MLEAGDPAPDIELRDDRGEPFRLADLRGRRVVLYFYPKASTPGCTIEACAFRDAAGEFAARNTVIVGVSPDTPEAQARFKRNRSLPFTLLADSGHAAAEAYGVWKQKNFLGKKFMGVERTTFLIDENGRIEKVFRKVKPLGHPAQILAADPGRE